MQLIYLGLEIDRPEFIGNPTFNVTPNIEDFLDAVPCAWLSAATTFRLIGTTATGFDVLCQDRISYL